MEQTQSKVSILLLLEQCRTIGTTNAQVAVVGLNPSSTGAVPDKIRKMNYLAITKSQSFFYWSSAGLKKAALDIDHESKVLILLLLEQCRTIEGMTLWQELSCLNPSSTGAVPDINIMSILFSGIKSQSFFYWSSAGHFGLLVAWDGSSLNPSSTGAVPDQHPRRRKPLCRKVSILLLLEQCRTLIDLIRITPN